MKLKPKLLIFVSLQILIIQGLSTSLYAAEIKGRVVNTVDSQPLPFAQVIYSSGKRGTSSNIDGWFSIPDTVRFMHLSYIGFHSINVSREKLQKGELIIRMIPMENEVLPVTGSTKDNAGLRIMKRVVENRGKNDPEKYNSYQYTSFQKFSLAPISLMTKVPHDTSLRVINQPFVGNALFSMETLSRKKMLQPDHKNEEIISAKVTGERKEPYLLLANQIQDLPVNAEFFTILDHSYLSPVSQYALIKYYFAVTDTFLNAGNDTVFTIRFNPKKRKSPIGLNGVMQINSHGYAVQSLMAERPLADKKVSALSIQQQYDLLPDGKWFPGEQITIVRFTLKSAANKDSVKRNRVRINNEFEAINRTSYYQREINLPLKPEDFPKYKVTINPNLRESAEKTIDSLQHEPFVKKDTIANPSPESISEANDLITKSKLIRLLAEGKIPVGYFNINYDRLFSYNLYEGIKLGVGAESNRRLSRYFTVGGYVTYGLKDKSVRQGEWFDIYPKGYYDFRVHLGYRDMNMEFGEPEFLEKKSLLNPEFFRSLLIENMYATQRFSLGVEVMPFQELNTYLFTDISNNSARQTNPFLVQHIFSPFNLVRAGLSLRYAPGITFIKDPDMMIENTTPKSDWFLNVIQGMNVFQGEYQYTKIEFKGKFHFQLSSKSMTSITLRAGHISDHGPITEYFNGYGSYVSAFSLIAQNSFTTMRQNEFGAADYSSIFLRHDLGLWFLSSGHKFNPDFVLAQNLGFGSLGNSNRILFGLNDFRKGYYESGFEINNILRMEFLSWGLGIYYRYGPYSLPNFGDNFAYKFGFIFKL